MASSIKNKIVSSITTKFYQLKKIQSEFKLLTKPIVVSMEDNTKFINPIL